MIALGALLSLIVPLVIIGLVARFVMHRIGADAPVARTLGAALHVGVVVAAINAVSALIELPVGGDEIFRDTPRIVAMNLAILFVAVPVSYVIWRSLFAETDDFPRRFAVVAGLAVALVTTVFSAVGVAQAVVGVEDLDASSLGNLLAFGGAWLGYEWWMRTREHGAFEVDDLSVTAASAAGLGLALAGLVLFIQTAISNVLGLSTDVIFEQSATDALRTAAVMAVIGAAVLARYWIFDLHDRETRFRNGYGAVVSYLSLTASAASVGVVAFLTLEWLFGLGSDTAASQFEGLPAAVAVGVAFGIAWWHHLGTVTPRRGLARRAYSYATAASGVFAAASGLVTLLAAGLESVTASDTVTTARIGSITIGGLIAIVIGMALWWAQWSRIDATDPAEVSSIPRRVYLVGLLVVSGVAGAVALITAIFGFLQAVFEGDLGLDVIFDGRFVIAIVVVTVPLVWHLAGELREDRLRRPIESSHRRAIVVAGDPGSLGDLDDVAFLRVQHDGGVVGDSMAGEIQSILAQDGPPVLVVVKGDRFEVTELESIPGAGPFGVFS